MLSPFECLCGNFILPEPASYVFFYALFNLRNLLYIIRLASASIIRCRSAHLVGVQPNSRLPPASSMRRAQQCRYFARSLPPSKRHSRLTIVRRGCWMCRIAGIHGEAMYTALTLRSACSSSRSRLPMCGVEGEGPSSFLLGD